MKYVAITGAYGGMGRATVELLKNNGYTVFALDKNVGQKEDGIIPIELDVQSEESVNSAFKIIASHTQKLDGVIHFAGIYVLHSLVEISEENFIRAFNINLFGVYRINKCFLPLLKDGGRIIITSSELAPLYPLPFTGLYAITKTAIERYAYSLRMEVQLLDIKVSVIRPGAVKTGLLKTSTDALDDFIESTANYKCNAERFKKIVNSVESKSVKPEKVAKKALRALTSKRPKYIYNLNRNVLLKLLNVLPKRLQNAIIKAILK